MAARVRGRGRELGRLRDELQSQIGIARGVRVAISDHLSTPLTWGWLRPVILLPGDSSSWSEERRRAILLHELGHVRRGDVLAQLAGHLGVAVHWFNPLAWLAYRRQSVERELACDDLVLGCEIAAEEYAECLIDLARRMRRQELAPAGAVRMARASRLEGRLRAILDASRIRSETTAKCSLS